MRVSAVIARLCELEQQHGDLDVLIDAGGLLEIDEIDLPVDEEGIIIWPVYEVIKD